MMRRTFVPDPAPQNSQTQPAWWFAFVGSQLLVHTEAAANQIPYCLNLAELGLTPVRTQFLGRLADQPCYSAELPKETIVPPGMALIGLRDLYGTIDEDWYALSGRAIQIVDWDRTHQYCGQCATPTIQLINERAKRCPQCRLVNYPRISPAMIVLISRGEELLLARAPRFPPGMYGLIAGFVEPGESLEETVIREVYEEVGITVKEIRYFSSQPWAFPNSLMIGFTASYAGGELTIDPQELETAAWFHKHNLPRLPPKPSIARRLIDWFVETH
jgi:NAD+ diphosphatase